MGLQVSDNATRYVVMRHDEITPRKFEFVYVHPGDYFDYIDRYDDGIFTCSILEDEDEKRGQTELENKYKKTVGFFEEDRIPNFNIFNAHKRAATVADALGNPGMIESEVISIIDAIRRLPGINLENNLLRQVYQSLSIGSMKQKVASGNSE